MPPSPRREPKCPRECPACDSCDSGSIGRRLAKERRNEYYCRDCGWHGKTFVPKKVPVRLTRHPRLASGGWAYTSYDVYGQPCVYSHVFSTRAACVKDAREDIECSPDPVYRGCAVIWPPFMVKGSIIRARKLKEK